MNLRPVLPYLTSASLLLLAAACSIQPTSMGGDRPLETSSDQIWQSTLDPTPHFTSTAAWSDELPMMAIALVDQAIPQTTSATLYTVDSSCAAFEPKTVNLPNQNSMGRAVGALLADPSVKSIPLAGYRVEQRLSGTVRVDLRFAPNMTKSVYALSSCEQFALFGSIRATLVQNPQWEVTQVIFTERGKELAL